MRFVIVLALLALPAHVYADDGSGSGSAAEPGKTDATDPWGSLQAGKGFLIGRTDRAELSISAYSLVRYLNQMPPGQTFTDHLGREHSIDARNDIFSHRLMVFFKGWIGVPKLVYQIVLWTVNTTDQRAIFGVIGYRFHKAFSLFGGLNGLPGSRTLLGNHPWWLGNDRVMADEFFRPYFTQGVWANGELLPGLNYMAMIGNNNSALGVTAKQLTRSKAYSASVWWMPTTLEFGPNGSFDDWEFHEHLATRFGISGVTSVEDRFSDVASNSPENTTLRLADAINVFDTGSLAPGVTIQDLRYTLLSADAGVKYRGIFVGGAYFQRWLTDMRADGTLPVSSIVDRGFYLQAAFYPVPHTLELYGATSWVFGDRDAGFHSSHEFLGGANWFFAPHTRDIRLNGQLIYVDRSPVSSVFGYYVGGEKGPIVALAVSIIF